LLPGIGVHRRLNKTQAATPLRASAPLRETRHRPPPRTRNSLASLREVKYTGRGPQATKGVQGGGDRL
jgi:hypothetical protein